MGDSTTIKIRKRPTHLLVKQGIILTNSQSADEAVELGMKALLEDIKNKRSKKKNFDLYGMLGI